MNTLVRTFCLILAVWLGYTNPAYSQKATEVYVPIGESPGLSETDSIVGVVHSIDYATRRIEIQTSEGLRTFSMNDATLYFLDRSKQRLTNTKGTIYDCEAGRVAEVKVSGNGNVDWIKIETS